jgi:hypothetical protein
MYIHQKGKVLFIFDLTVELPQAPIPAPKSKLDTIPQT